MCSLLQGLGFRRCTIREERSAFSSSFRKCVDLLPVSFLDDALTADLAVRDHDYTIHLICQAEIMRNNNDRYTPFPVQGTEQVLDPL